MANHNDTMQKEKYLNVLLEDGCKYLKIADVLLKSNRDDLPNFQKTLAMMDSLSRHRTVLKEDLETLKEVEGVIHMDEEEEEEVEEEEEDTDEDQESLTSGEYDKADWLHRLSSSLSYRKNILMNLEIQLMKKLDFHGKQVKIRSEMNCIFQNYRRMADAVLRQTKSIENCFKKDRRLASRFTGKREKLKRILADINEKQQFFWETK
nr:uncharacterized protein LOC117229011 isoform X1 [Megalopta genalis]